MKSRIMFCLLLVAMCSVAQRCGKDEVFISCGSVCYQNELSCIPPKPIDEKSCIHFCLGTCVCAPGYFRHHSGHCVTKANC
ncbi:PREDICTED: chymotrypsin inhibitor-like isoform X2 [Nicrophorus vespilloides]|uniref:Chymotrypsin inhibitor-like isoform X2 n=1 Tax=Nicrophorus vespilloides TaxID=110193 RepID=A0ABM1NJI7_NICVS|nr:PREDICTED: chymotrypsin inhibitor-like isoform X2 [Nicrophorus vespilloides]